MADQLPDDGKGGPATQGTGWLGPLAVAVFVALLLHAFWGTAPEQPEIPYSRFLELLDDGRLETVRVGETWISGTLRDPPTAAPTPFRTRRVAADIAGALAAEGVPFSGEADTGGDLWNMLVFLLPTLLLIGFWVVAMGRAGGGRGLGGFMSIGKSKAKIFAEKDIKVRFDDVAGVDEAKAELVEIVNFLTAPETFERLGARVPKGVLLVGPPGTGKTLLARAVAGETGVPFFSINGSEFVEMFVGVGAARVRDLFEQARAVAPCIIFIDELDALGRARGAFPGIGGHDEKEQTLNQLLAELDGFDPGAGIVLLAATNRPEILDPALLRAGRFDRQVLVDRPDKIGRLAILRVHVRRVRLAASVDLEAVAAMTPGFSGADLANLVNEAATIATRRGAAAVTLDDFTAGIERIVAGLEKRSRLLNPRERAVVAHHEMGHALVAMAIPGCDPVQKVSIIPRGIGALGYTIQRPIEDRYLMGRLELMAKMAVLLGGRAAELITFPDVSTGAADDLAKATEIARSMVMRYGMDEALGAVAYDTEEGRLLGQGEGQYWKPRRYSEGTAVAIDDAVRTLVSAALDRARAILEDNRATLTAGAALLLEHETLTADEIPRPTAERTGEAA